MAKPPPIGLTPLRAAGPPAPQGRPELDPQRLYAMGRAAITARQFDNAIEALERVVCLAPDMIDAQISLIHAHVDAGNHETARALIGLLRARKPDTPMSDFEDAKIFAQNGQFEDARALLRRVTQAHPKYAPAWHSLATLGRVTPDDPLIGELQRRIADAAESSADMMFLSMALAKVYDDIGEYDLAFEAQSRAKRQFPASYNHQEHELRFNSIKDVFTRSFFAKRADFGAQSDLPIFVLGMPRSGTSLVEQILASHPDIHGSGELEYLSMAGGELISLTPDNAPIHRAALKVSKETAAITGYRYVRRLARLAPSARRIIDKMPHNFQSIGLIGLLLPQARIVHCARSPIDTCFSIFMQNFTQDHAYAHQLDTLGRYYRLYASLMDHWREHSPIAIHEFENERVIGDQRGETEKLAAYAGVSWDERLMTFHKTERRVGTPSNVQVRSPINASGQERWRRYERHLAPLIEALGPYAPS